MPEAFAFLAVVVVCVAAYVAALLRSRDPSLHNAAEELARLRQHEAWLRQRLALAERERWGAEMSDGLVDELRATSQQLARATQNSRPPGL